MPRWPSAASAFTSGTTSGTAGSIRKALDLSTTTHPRATASGAYRFDVDPPAENSARSNSPRLSAVSSATSSSSPANATRLPAERADAKAATSAAGKPRSASTSSTTGPTAPVAPTTATRGLRTHRSVGRHLELGLEGVVQRGDRLADPGAVDHAGDLDRRGRDHAHGDPAVGQHLEPAR